MLIDTDFEKRYLKALARGQGDSFIHGLGRDLAELEAILHQQPTIITLLQGSIPENPLPQAVLDSLDKLIFDQSQRTKPSDGTPFFPPQ